MEFSIVREELLKPLQLVSGIVEKRQTLPILSNILLRVGQQLTIIATDLEVELLINLPIQSSVESGEATVPARKLVDICRSLHDGALIEFDSEQDKMIIRSGRSRFSLSTLPASEYPYLDYTKDTLNFDIEQKQLRFLLQRTQFAMAQQDVRYYLNGMLLEIKNGLMRAVATDGHRLALNTIATSIEVNDAKFQVIVPRKGVVELQKLLDGNDLVSVSLMTNHLRVSNSNFTFTSKLIEGLFPEYERVLPTGGDKIICLPREILKQSLNRASILSNEKLRGVQLQLRPGMLRVLANNPEQEEAEEELSIDYDQADLNIGLNVEYLIDIFETIDDESVTLTFSDSNSSILVVGSQSKDISIFVVMPMRI